MIIEPAAFETAMKRIAGCENRCHGKGGDFSGYTDAGKILLDLDNLK